MVYDNKSGTARGDCSDSPGPLPARRPQMTGETNGRSHDPAVQADDAPSVIPPAAHNAHSGRPWLGIIAVLYAAAVCAFEVYVIAGISQASAMELDQYTLQFFVLLPLAILTGVTLCTIVGVRSRRARKPAVVGGLLMLAPLVVLVVSSVVANILLIGTL